ncbi:MAG: hypothetical protein MUF10_10380 [Thermoanaerobaculaceae bacterium]|jgi:uncharacterized membrane protein|nr:hypothetical protein [Thermoanaerobaculaceae bacterium]
MAEWLWYGVAAAVLYGLHQVFTKLAAPHIGSGPGALIVEASAAAVVGLFLGYSRWVARQPQDVSATGVWYSLLTGLCVGVGTITFFLLFQRGGPLSAVPAILAGGAAIMAAVGMVFLGEATSWPRILGVLLAIVSLVLLNAGAPK